jgi:hypothetical protein
MGCKNWTTTQTPTLPFTPNPSPKFLIYWYLPRKPCVVVSTSTIISYFRSHASPIRSRDSLLLLLPCCCIWLSGLGSQDLGFRTSMHARTDARNSQDLGFRTLTDARKLFILRLSTGARSCVLSFSRHFSLRPVVIDAGTQPCHFSLRPVVTDRHTDARMHRRNKRLYI